MVTKSEDETAEHRKREQQRAKFLLSRKEQRRSDQRRERDNDYDVDVAESSEHNHGALMRRSVHYGNNEMDQN